MPAKGVFAHGMLTMGLIGKMLTNYVGDARLKKLACVSPTRWPGDTPTHRDVAAIRQRTASIRRFTFHVNQGQKWWRGRPPRRWTRKGSRRTKFPLVILLQGHP